MNFELSEEQEMLRAQARRLLQERCASSDVREILEGESAFDLDLWRGVAELGWTATALPARYGGFGMGYLELCVLAEELGRAVAPIPFSSSVYLASEAIRAAGSADQQARLLPGLGTGERIGTLALAEGAGGVADSAVAATFDGATLSGSKLPVPDGDIADLAVVVAREGDRGLTLLVVDLRAPGVSRDPLATIDASRSHARVVFENAPAERLGRAGKGWSDLERVLDRAAVLFSFEQLGGAQASLDMAVEYAKNRYAFGRPVGSFQAIKHRLADLYCLVELARSNCYYGAWALAADAAELPVAAATARLGATRAFHECAKENIQVHGGMGFTWAFDCHMYYRRSKLLALALGNEVEWKQKLITRLRARGAAQDATARA